VRTIVGWTEICIESRTLEDVRAAAHSIFVYKHTNKRHSFTSRPSLSVTFDRSVVFSVYFGFLPNKTERNDITEILLKVALSTIKPTNQPLSEFSFNLSRITIPSDCCYTTAEKLVNMSISVDSRGNKKQ
jgi:hypothetical protein